jgi:rare lipoprotein A (peptidoglycan hydrolase)
VVALLFCGAVLFLPLLLLRNGPDASASPAPSRVDVAAGPAHARPSDPRTTPRLADRTGRSSRRTGGSGTAPVEIADVPARVDVSTTTTTTTTTTTVAPTTTTVPPTTTTVPPTTTTTTTDPQPAAGVDIVTTGVVTYYAHPAGTCASPWLPFGTVVRVTNPANGASVTCVVDDREADTQRSIDLATATFAEIAPLWQGVVDAQLTW